MPRSTFIQTCSNLRPMPDPVRNASDPAAGPILIILLEPDKQAEARLALLHAMHSGTRLVLLTQAEYAARLEGFADEVWGEGIARGPSRFLALVRRMSWMNFAHVHELDGSVMSQILRFCVWPRPKWHSFRP